VRVSGTAIDAALLGLRYRGAPHVESWFLKANDPSGERALWVRTTIFAREGSPPLAEAWAIAFDRAQGHVAAKTTVPFADARFAHGAVDAAVDGCELSLGRTKGSLATGTRAIAWDLEIGPERATPIAHLPSRALYADGVPPFTKLVTPLADARVTGTVRVHDGERAPDADEADQADQKEWRLDGWPAMLGHNWGRGHAPLYAWSHCNAWDDADDLVFEGVSARVRLGAVLSPVATSAFVRYRGRRIEFRSLLANRGTISLRRWECVAEAAGARLVCELAAETDDFVGLHYANPSSGMTYCLNSKLARARLELSLPGGETVAATSRAAALEIGTRENTHGVRMYL
jgi:hypothetical protein